MDHPPTGYILLRCRKIFTHGMSLPTVLDDPAEHVGPIINSVAYYTARHDVAPYVMLIHPVPQATGKKPKPIFKP